MIDKEILIKKLETLKQEREKAYLQMCTIDGAVQLCEQLLLLCEENIKSAECVADKALELKVEK